MMVTTLAPRRYCSGLVRQFRIGTVVVGESVNFSGGWLDATTALPSMISMTPLVSPSWPSTLRRIPTSGMRISARSKAWPWSLLDERGRHIEIQTPGLGDLLGDHGRGQIKPVRRRIENPTI